MTERWIFKIGQSHRKYDSMCKESQNPNAANTWYGWTPNESVGAVSKHLNGSGSGKLVYGNCYSYTVPGRTDDVVNVYLNGVLLSQAGPGETKEVKFQYNDNDKLKIEEGHAIIKIHQVAFNCGKTVNQIDISIFTNVIIFQVSNVNS